MPKNCYPLLNTPTMNNSNIHELKHTLHLYISGAGLKRLNCTKLVTYNILRNDYNSTLKKHVSCRFF